MFHQDALRQETGEARRAIGGVEETRPSRDRQSLEEVATDRFDLSDFRGPESVARSPVEHAAYPQIHVHKRDISRTRPHLLRVETTFGRAAADQPAFPLPKARRD